MGATEGAHAYVEKMSLEKLAELITLKLLIAKPDDPIAHLKGELENMIKRTGNMDAHISVTSELQRLYLTTRVLPCDWMEKEAKAIIGFLAEAVERGVTVETADTTVSITKNL